MDRNTKTSDFFYLGIILICCCVAFWPLTFSIYSLKNDALNYFLPVRYNISEAIQNGYWPFWSPYINLGYPLHGDMQSGVWNPFVQIFSLFGIYTIRMLQYETLLYVYISGIGMFYLLKYFIPEKNICLFGAISYMLCGYISDSAQFLNWISSASFIPLVFLFYYRSLMEKSIKQPLYCSLFLFLLFTTAYPADFIIMCYLLLALFITYIIRIRFQKQELVKLLSRHIVLAVAFILLSLPAIISYAEFLPLTERGSGAGFQTAMSNPLHPKLLFAYLTPIGVWKAPGVNITDPLERNSYIGLFAFSFLLISFVSPHKNFIYIFSKWAFFVFILFSFGTYGGVRVLSYYLLPLMDTFRHPANAKIFTTLFAIILASITLKHFKLVDYTQKNIKVAFGILLIFLALIFCWSLFYPVTFGTDSISLSSKQLGTQIKALIDQFTFADLVIINIALQLPFLIILFLFFIKKIKLNFLILSGILNSVIHVMLFQPFTVVKKDTVDSTQRILESIIVDGYPIPNTIKSLKENSINGDLYFNEIGVSNLYNKQIGRVEYRITPSNLLNQNTFWYDEKWRNYYFDLPVFYKADTIILAQNKANTLPADTSIIYMLSNNESIAQHINALHSQNNVYNYKFLNFSPNSWTLKINSTQPGYYCFFQNNYPRWRVYIDGKRTRVDISNISFIGFSIPAGNHIISFNYASNDLKATYLISIFVIFFIIFIAVKSNAQRIKSSFPS